MKKFQIAMVLATAGMLATGCESLAKYSAEMDKQAAEQRRAAMVERHLRENSNCEPVKVTDLQKAAVAAEKLLTSKGYTVETKQNNQGFGGDGLWISGHKVKNVDLGNNIGMNLLGSALGADTNKIIKRNEEYAHVYLRHKWSSDGMGDGGATLLQVNGSRFKVNQADQKVDEQQLSMTEAVALKDEVLKVIVQ
jgi:hypothetical protein